VTEKPKPYRVILLDTPWHQCLQDTASLLSLGLAASILFTRPELYADSRKYRDVILGLHASPRVPIPRDSIIYNTEHPSTWSDEYQFLLETHEVWTYSAHTGVGKHIPLGYHPGFRRVPLNAEADRDIDVLHFGSINARRRSLLCHIESQGLRVCVAPLGTFAADLDDLIARSKIVVNIHYYTQPACFEYARVVPLIHSGACVISEYSEAWEGLGLAAMAPYSELPKEIKDLIDRPEARARIAQSCLRYLEAKPMSKILEHVK
jgi:hypothetical protein